MTTAARPTFEPARGREKDLGALSKQYSSRDLPGHTKLKYRQSGQGNQDENRSRDFRRELEEREDRERSGKKRSHGDSRGGGDRVTAPQAIPVANLDADEPLKMSSSEESSDDDEDDAAELMAELMRIKKQRLEEEQRREEEKRQQDEKIRMENILSGNPLLQGGSASRDFKVKRRWDDDVVFKNCAKGEPDSSKKGFINDTLRSEFHKKFMEKYIK